MLAGTGRSALETDFQNEVAQRATRIVVAGRSTPEVDAMVVHDEADEVELAYALVQDAALGSDKIPPHEIAIVVPARDPYAKLLEGIGQEWNGLAARSLAETQAGVSLASIPWTEPTWKEIAEVWPAAIKDKTESAQVLRDQIESWAIIQEMGLPPARSLVEALRLAALTKPTPRTTAFGDGVFVGLPSHFSGLAFRRTLVLGFASNRFPSSARAIPLLPPGVGVLKPEAQRQAFSELVSAAGHLTLIYSRTDRRNGREAFASPWLPDWVPEPCKFESSLHLIEKLGPRSGSAVRVARSLTEGSAPARAQRLLDAWDAGDLALEGNSGGSLRLSGR